MKAGLLLFRDAAGNINSYNMRTLDPRGIGLNPVISGFYDLLPAGNDTTGGDGLNTIRFTGEADSSFNSDTFVLRLDRNVSTNWRADVNYRFGSIRELGAAQADISGLLPGNVKGQPVALEDLPREPRFLAGGLTGQLSPHFSTKHACPTCAATWRSPASIRSRRCPGSTSRWTSASSTSRSA